jgi:hypothetical protein
MTELRDRPAAPGRASSPWRARLRAVSPDTWGMVFVAAVVIAANLPYLLGISDINPLGPRSGLVVAQTLGPAGGQPTIDPNNGFISQAVSHRAALDLLHLQLPWWNPFEGTGVPLAGGMQAAAFFPPTLLTALGNGQIWEHVLLELIAGLATYALLRRLSLVRPAAVAAGIAFGLDGTFAWFSHATVNPVAFLPLLLLGIEYAYTAAAEARRGGWWLIAIAGTLSYCAGFPEVTYIDTLLAVLWFAWRCGCVPRERLRALLVKGAAAAVTAVLLAAPLLIAMIDYTNHGDLGAHGGAFFGAGHIPRQGLSQLLFPYIYGPILDYTDPKFTLTAIWYTVGGYLSTSLLLFAVFGLFARGRRALRLILLAWIVLVLARMYGLPVLGAVLGVLPGMSRVAFFRYATASLELAVIVLAALGIDDLARHRPERRRVAGLALAVLAVAAVAVVTAHPLAAALGPKFAHRPYFAAAIAWGVAVILAGAAVMLLRDVRRRTVLAAVLLAGDAFVLFVIPEASAPRAVQVDTAPAAFLQRHLGIERAFTLGPLQPNYGAYFGVGLLDVNDVPVPSLLTHYIHTRLDPYVNPEVFVGNLGGGRSPAVPSPAQELVRNLDGYRAAAVHYVLTPAGQSLPQTPSTFRLVFRSPSTWIYALAGSSPYYDAGPGCRTVAAGRQRVRVTCTGPAQLIRRETYAPGWSASVDGQSVPVRETGGLFQGVSVPAGTHEVSFSFSPPFVGWGYLAFVAGLLALGAPALVGRLRR